MVASNKLALATLAAAVVVATPVPKAQEIQERGLLDGLVDLLNSLTSNSATTSLFTEISTALQNLGSGLSDAVDSLLHLDTSGTADGVTSALDSVNTLLQSLLGSLDGFTASTGVAGQLESVYTQNALGGIVDQLVTVVNALVDGILKDDSVENLGSSVESLVNNLDSLITGLANSGLGLDSITSELQSLLDQINSAVAGVSA